MSKLPKYQILANTLQDEIQHGHYVPGDRLPSEPELSAQYAISRQTVRQALSILEQDGLIVRKKGSGSIVQDAQTAAEPSPLSTPSYAVGIITSFVGEYLFSDILAGVQEVLAPAGYCPTVFETHNRFDTERKVLQDVLSRPLDALIVEGVKTALPSPNLDLFEQLSATGKPVVYFHAFSSDIPHPVYVATQDWDGGRSATQYLIDHGHTKIAGIFKSDDIQGLRRFSGYCQALRENHIPLSDDLIAWFSTENMDKVSDFPIAQLIQDSTAIVCYNDETALQVMEALQKAQLRVPDDVSLIGFDNSIYGKLAPVKLTSCAQDKRLVGKLLAQKVLNMLHGNAESPTTLPWTIQPRESVADLRQVR